MSASEEVPPSLPSSSAPPIIRISHGSSRFSSSPLPESPRTPTFDRTSILREGAMLERSGSSASSRSGGTLPGTPRTGTPTRFSASTPRPRSPPAVVSSHAGGILPPTSFFRVSGRGTPQRAAGPALSMPLGPPPSARPSMQSPSSSRLPVVLPLGSRSASTSDAETDTIPMSALTSRRSAVDSSFDASVDEHGAAEPAASYTAAQSYRSKPSRDPLIQKSVPGDSVRITPSEGPVRNALVGGFVRRSVDSQRRSFDLEQGRPPTREPPVEPSPDFLSSNRGTPVPHIVSRTQTPSFMTSDDPPIGYTFHTARRGMSTPDVRRSNISAIPRGEPKATIHPHPIITPAAPLMDPKTNKPMRNHQLIPSKNTWFLGGKALTGGDSPLPFVATLVSLFGIAGVWFSCTAPWWWHNVSVAVPIVAAYMTLFSIASLFMTAFRDPGILPRDIDLDPPMASIDDDGPPVPLPRDLRVRAGVVRIKYCPSCKLYRPPRSSHCRLCDNCVDGCDHHCQWVNNCVGRRNYTHFFTFLISVSLTDIYVIITSALHIYLYSSRNHLSFAHTLSHTIGSAVCFVLSTAMIWPILTLLGYHCRLVLLNITTIEQVRSQARNTLAPAESQTNPFTLGKWTKNVTYILCRPPGYTWIQGDEVAMEDKRVVNPGARARMDWKMEDDDLYGPR
ncbi:hypothetical protein DL93DRAFT_1940535 [Clavulina sp. PMI_390]|nr:hypothetical protein DL93DRAFT_1940535 [Clavulina sp. PMI_390]